MLKKLISTNPARNYEKIDEVEISREEEIIEKVNKAQKAKLGWKEMSLEDRIPYFEKLMAVYKKRGEEVAEIQTKEVGKVIKESREDVEFDLFGIENNIRIAREVLKPEILDESETQKNILYFEPYGIMVVIVPWNFPSSNFFISCIQPLLAGNTIVFKHSEECPLTGKILEEIMEEAGFPEGVFSEVYGDGKVGDMLTNQAIDAIHFTGSTKIGRYLYEKAALKFIPATLEMGGSSPGIIFKDANLDMACKHALAERFL